MSKTNKQTNSDTTLPLLENCDVQPHVRAVVLEQLACIDGVICYPNDARGKVSIVGGGRGRWRVVGWGGGGGEEEEASFSSTRVH